MGTNTAVSHLRGDGRGWTLIAIALGWVFVLGGRFLVPAVLPQVKATFAVGNLGVGVAVTLIWAAYALMQSPAGVLIDRLGEQRLLTGSLLLTGGTVVILGIAPVFIIFLFGCGAFGFATGLYGPARGTALSRTFPNNDSAAIGATLAAGSLGSAILPLTAGVLVDTLGWRTVVTALVPLLVLASVLTHRVVIQTYVSTSTSTSTSITTSPASDTSETVSQSQTPSIQKLITSGVRALRHQGVALAGAAVALMLFAFQGLSAFYVTYLVSAKQLDQSLAAGMLALLFIGGAVTQLIAGPITDRFGERITLTTMTALGVPALIAVPFIDDLILLAIVSVLIGSRLGIAPVSNAYIIAVLPDTVTGTAWGTLRSGFFLFAATGSTIVGAMAGRGLLEESFFLLAAITAVAAVLYARLPNRENTHSDADTHVS
ncbi:MFS transporter [Haloquadratum walsbyi]|jgi:Arabinose efflux permease|uniref:Arabinose efflux permease n=1 Tax=Haloquadratum walsbyi J07HQW2 TaxID=1238425 RepID=U1ND37_9EURY|nr:MFS transporter [Haloquadratum walsbyi]ERG94623.1 MAG: arabinose efflux permease [Haloquadratum walsbyi J07HQW2]